MRLRAALGTVALAAAASFPLTGTAVTDAGSSISPIDLPLMLPVHRAAPQAAFLASEAWQVFQSAEGPGWHATWDARSGVPRWINGPGINLGSVNEGNVEELCLDVVRTHPEIFGVHTSELKLSHARKVGERWFVTMDRYYDDVLVGGGRVDFRIMPGGRLTLIGVNTHPRIDLDVQPSIGLNEARHLAAAAVGGADKKAESEGHLVIVPLAVGDDIGYALAWEVVVETTAPVGRWVQQIDAENGAVIARWNEVRYAQIGGEIGGTILLETPTDPPEYFPYGYENITVDGAAPIQSDVDGLWMEQVGPGDHAIESTLTGTWVDVRHRQQANAELSATAPANQRTDLLWDDENSTIDERNGYLHTVLVHDYMKQIDPTFVDLDYSMPCNVVEPGSCNAFWNGLSMTFFEANGGCPSIVRIADVVYHEYGHGTTQHANGNQATGAMHEGFSDYLGVTIGDQPLIGRGFFGPGSHLRNCVNNVVYPAPECGGAVHCVGQAHCGALWDARTNLVAALGHEEGVALSDSLWHYARYGHADNDLDYYVDYLLMDDDDGDLSNGTPHGEHLFPALAAHGFVKTMQLSQGFVYDAATPELIADAGDELTGVVSYMLPIGAQSASDLNASLSSLSPLLTVTKSNSSLPNLVPGETVTNTADPFLIEVSPDLTEIVDVELVVEITADPNFFNRIDTLTVRIGRSQVLLVDDDPADDLAIWYEEPLEALGNAPYKWVIRDAGYPGFNPLMAFDTVIWFTGNATEGTIGETEQAILADYLDAGGQLLLAGQNIGEEIGTTDFFTNYLKSELVNSNAGLPLVDGVADDPLTSSWSFFLTGAGGANNWSSPDAVSAVGGARDAFVYRGSAFGAGVVYDADYRLVYLPFNFEGATGGADTTPRIRALSGVLQFFGVPVGVRAVGAEGNALAEGNLLRWNLVGAGAELAEVYVDRIEADASLTRLNSLAIVGSGEYLDREAQTDGLFRYQVVVLVDGEESSQQEIQIRRGETPALPSRVMLAQNSPNPFNPRTVINYELPLSSVVELVIYDITGHKIATLVDGDREAGRHSVVWEGKTAAGALAPSGVYLYRLRTDTESTSRRMLLVK